MNKFEYKNLTPFKWFILENFPFIEADFDALTNWQLFCKLGKEMNKIINNTNTLGEQVENVTNAFIELQNYINNYFDNLDVQEEINNKLDEMVADGTLQEIIAEYLQTRAILAFNSIAELKEGTNLTNGSFVKTYGYYNANDGGGAFYKVRNVTNQDVEDDAFIIALNDTNLVAEIVIENDTINIKQIGATTSNDIKPYIEKYLAKNEEKLTLYIPYGSWICSELLINKWFNITGENIFCGKTNISPLNNTQDFIIKLYNANSLPSHWKLANINFTTGSSKTVETCLEIDHFEYGEVDNVNFQNVRGRAIVLKNCWEINFTNLIARNVAPLLKGIDAGVIEFADTSNGSISTLYFNYIQLEVITGNVFVVRSNCGIYNNHIGTINIEQPQGNTINNLIPEITFGTVTDETNPTNHLALFKMLDNSAFGGLSINSIDTNNLASTIITYENNDYIMDSIIYKAGAESTNKTMSAQIDMINFVGMLKDIQLLNVRNGANNVINTGSKLIINSVNYSSTQHEAYFNCKKENGIKCLSGIVNFNNNDKILSQNLIFAGDITTRLEHVYNQYWGMQCYDKDSLSPNKLVFAPFSTRNEGGYIKVIGMGNLLRLRYKVSSTRNISIYDERTETSHNYVVNNTNGEWAYLNCYLSTDISNYTPGDILQIGFTAGFSCYIDSMFFTN